MPPPRAPPKWIAACPPPPCPMLKCAPPPPPPRCPPPPPPPPLPLPESTRAVQSRRPAAPMLIANFHMTRAPRNTRSSYQNANVRAGVPCNRGIAAVQERRSADDAVIEAQRGPSSACL